MGSHAPSRVDVFQPSSSLSIRPHPEPLPHQLSFLELISALHKGQYNLLYLLRTCSISLQLYSPEIALCPTLPQSHMRGPSKGTGPSRAEFLPLCYWFQ